jgi:hypothetical protein
MVACGLMFVSRGDKSWKMAIRYTFAKPATSSGLWRCFLSLLRESARIAGDSGRDNTRLYVCGPFRYEALWTRRQSVAMLQAWTAWWLNLELRPPRKIVLMSTVQASRLTWLSQLPLLSQELVHGFESHCGHEFSFFSGKHFAWYEPSYAECCLNEIWY